MVPAPPNLCDALHFYKMIAPYPLIVKPTPCHRLDRLSDRLGCELWIKRDDLTGFAAGGNKGRKLEYILAKALQDGVTTLVTCGSSESNFIRHLAVAGAVAGLRVVAVTMDHPYEEGYQAKEPPAARPANQIINRLAGLERVHMPDGTWDELFAKADAIAADQPGRVLNIPIGGSSGWGGFAFFEAAKEVDDFDRIVCPTSSGSTHAGLQTYFQGSKTKVTGIACDPEPALIEDVLEVSRQLAEILDRPSLTERDFDLRREYVGPGYGIPSEAGNAAIQTLLRTEGILLDPVYSGKAFSGLLGMIEAGECRGERTLFWHTGGIPAVFSQL